MRSRFVASTGAALLLLSMLTSTVAASIGRAPIVDESVPSIYLTDCTTSPTTHGYTWRRNNVDIGTGIDGARFLIVVRALEPCTNGDATHPSKSFIGVSVQGSVLGVTNFPQLGLCKFRMNGVDQTYWCQIPPTWAGQPDVNPSWASGLGLPVAGRSYTLTIKLKNLGATVPSWYWYYSIKDNTTGTTVSDTITVAGSGHSATNPTLVGEAWWGCEVGSTANVLGTKEPLARIYMQDAAYLKNSDTAWYYTQNSQINSPWDPNPAYYDVHQDDGGVFSSDRVWCTTADH